MFFFFLFVSSFRSVPKKRKKKRFITVTQLSAMLPTLLLLSVSSVSSRSSIVIVIHVVRSFKMKGFRFTKYSDVITIFGPDQELGKVNLSSKLRFLNKGSMNFFGSPLATSINNAK